MGLISDADHERSEQDEVHFRHPAVPTIEVSMDAFMTFGNVMMISTICKAENFSMSIDIWVTMDGF